MMDCQEKSVLFVTNNATKSRKNYKKKFDKLGVEAHVVSYLMTAMMKRGFRITDDLHVGWYGGGIPFFRMRFSVPRLRLQSISHPS